MWVSEDLRVEKVHQQLQVSYCEVVITGDSTTLVECRERVEMKGSTNSYTYDRPTLIVSQNFCCWRR